MPVPIGYEFHHIGYATTSLEREVELFEHLGYKRDGELFCDEAQGVQGCFMTGSGPRIELLKDLPRSSTLRPWIDAGVKMYHLGFWVRDVDDGLRWVLAHRGRVISAPTPAIAFGGRRVAFAMFRTGQLVELIERDRSPTGA